MTPTPAPMAPFGIEAAMRAFLKTLPKKLRPIVSFWHVSKVVAAAGKHGPHRPGRAFVHLPNEVRTWAKPAWPVFWTAWCEAAGVSHGIEQALRGETHEVRTNGNRLLQTIEDACEGRLHLGAGVPHRTVAAVGRIVLQRNDCAKALHVLVTRADADPLDTDVAAGRRALERVPPAVYGAPFDPPAS